MGESVYQPALPFVVARTEPATPATAAQQADRSEPALPIAEMRQTDLMVEAFLALRAAFFDHRGQPIPYELRDKRETQDDPFDHHVGELLAGSLPADVVCARASGPLISPDLIVYRRAQCNDMPREVLRDDLARIVGLEVKKLQRSKSKGGRVRRATGLDYNSTPPCGTVQAYDVTSQPLEIRGFYLFACQEVVPQARRTYRLSALTLCDGNVLNADFDLYQRIAVRPRTKTIGLGTYSDGVDRVRPMLIFANPLGAPELDHAVTLVHPRADLDTVYRELRRVGQIRRTILAGGTHQFFCFRHEYDVPAIFIQFDRADLPAPKRDRVKTTQQRGRFSIDVRPGL